MIYNDTQNKWTQRPSQHRNKKVLGNIILYNI